MTPSCDIAMTRAVTSKKAALRGGAYSTRTENSNIRNLLALRAAGLHDQHHLRERFGINEKNSSMVSRIIVAVLLLLDRCLTGLVWPDK